MSAIQDRPNTLPWPPLVFVATVALAIVLQWLVPLPWLSGLASEMLFAVGWLLAAGAIAMVVAALRALRRADTSPSPIQGATHLVTGGPFSFTRNPLYLAVVMLLIGIGLIAGSVWFVVLAPVAAFVVQKLAIEREEQHLAARFGKKWRDYAKRVRRWI